MDSKSTHFEITICNIGNNPHFNATKRRFNSFASNGKTMENIKQ